MILAWALDQVVDLNNGLADSFPLTFSEEVLCLATVFSYSSVMMLVSLTYKFICSEDQKKGDDNMGFMSMGFAILVVLIPLNMIIRMSDTN